MQSEFEGFGPELFKFFRQLEKNNDRDWFAEHKPTYEQQVMQPALSLVTCMQPRLEKVAPCFTAVPRRSGGSIMRIYRDIRFSKNKQPFKTNLGIHFRHEVGKDVHAPGFYFHIDPKSVFFGAGIWHPANPELNKIRALIDDNPKRWKQVINRKAFRETFERQGESLKRPPRGYQEDHPLIDDLKMKDHIAIVELEREQIYDRKLMDVLVKHMKTSMPFMRFLCDALLLPC